MSSSQQLCQAACRLYAHSLALRLDQAGTEPRCKHKVVTGDSSNHITSNWSRVRAQAATGHRHTGMWRAHATQVETAGSADRTDCHAMRLLFVMRLC